MLPQTLVALSLLTTTIDAPCPSRPTFTAGCYVPPPVNTIYLSDPDDAWTRMHELGHAADALRLSDGERHRISCHRAMKAARTASPCGKAWVHLQERFADGFATCNLPIDAYHITELGSGYGYQPKTMRQHANFCRLIDRAASS